MFKNISDFIYRLRLLTKTGATRQNIDDLAQDLWEPINTLEETTAEHTTRLETLRNIIAALDTNQRELAASTTVNRNLSTALDKRLTALEGKLATLEQALNDLAVVQAEHHEALTTLEGEAK